MIPVVMLYWFPCNVMIERGIHSMFSLLKL